MFCVFHIPGSMPPNSQFLWQEGMCVKSYKLVSEGKFQEDGMYVNYIRIATQLLQEV